MGQKAKLYYESHITIEPVFDERLEQFKEICKPFSFQAASLLMKKRAQDTPERSQYDTFATGHGQDLDDIYARTRYLVIKLQTEGYQVWRYKVEDTLMDSRNEDVLELLKGK